MVEATAWHWGVAPHEALIALGWISQEDYVTALAKLLGLGVITTQITLSPLAGAENDTPFPGLVRAVLDDGDGAQFFALDGLANSPGDIRAMLAQHGFGSRQVVLVSRNVLRYGEETARSKDFLAAAIGGFRQASPELSAGTPVWLWQSLALTTLLGLAIGGLIVAPVVTSAVFTSVMAVPFLCVVMLRSAALFVGTGVDAGVDAGTTARPGTAIRQCDGSEYCAPADEHSPAPPVAAIPDAQLPHYSILVPLFEETEILPDLIQALLELDYPAAKMEIFLILESVDGQMQRASAALNLPPHIRVIIVPEAAPRTKPKALNYALQLARGDYVVVYDAEDLPQRDQLRLAVASFKAGAAQLACVQAQLNIYNPHDSWLSRQFAIEYTALFDAILPTLRRLNIPVPLGGTSNHLPRDLLLQIGGWDPFNVTEDADLGIRLARAGYSTQILNSTTWEEAPTQLWAWVQQRTRWLKGWMQTYLVHSRQPLVLLRDLGLKKFIGFHILMGGIMVSVLMHPLFYLLMAVDLAFDRFLSVPDTVLLQVLWGVAGFNLVLGYVSAMALGAVTVSRRKRFGLIIHVALMPFYWLLVSFAAYRALWQSLTAPYKWEKTSHHARPPGIGGNRRGA